MYPVPVHCSGPRFRVSPLVMGHDFVTSLCRIVSANGGPFTILQVLRVYDDGSQIGMSDLSRATEILEPAMP